MNTATNPFPSSNAAPRDLREGGPGGAGAGKIYPNKPEAVKKLKALMAARETAVTPASQVEAAPEPAKRPPTPGVLNPAEIYPAAVIVAAKREMTKMPKARRFGDVLTPEILAMWHRWATEDGRSLTWIAQNNGLIEVSLSSVSKILKAYRESLATKPTETLAATTAVAAPLQLSEEPTAPPAETGTAVAELVHPFEGMEDVATDTAEPEIEAMETAVAPFVEERPENLPTFFDREYKPPRPGPGDALATLAALVNNEALRVKGSVKLNLEIEFGD